MLHFGRLTAFGGAIALLLALATVDDALAQKKKDGGKAKGTPATPADYLQLQNRKDITGTILAAGGPGNTVSIRLEFPHLEPNPNYKPPTVTNPKAPGYNAQANQQYQMMRQYEQIQREMQQAAKAKTPQEQQRLLAKAQMDLMRFQMQHQQQYMKDLAKLTKEPGKTNPANEPFHVVTTTKDYELEVQEGALVRKMFLPTEFNDTGSLRVYTEKEKAELRGDDKTKPGYKSKLDEAAPGTEAKLFLTPAKVKKKDAKPDDEGVGAVDRPTVNMIILTKESSTPSIPIGDPKKKKDKK
jgi:hypothetical protein